MAPGHLQGAMSAAVRATLDKLDKIDRDYARGLLTRDEAADARVVAIGTYRASLATVAGIAGPDGRPA